MGDTNPKMGGRYSLEMILHPDFATLSVRGAIGAEVYVMEGESFLLHVGTITSPEGLTVNDRLLTGNYQIVGLHKSLMPALSDQMRLARAPVEITFQQPPKPTELVVVTEPVGATVFVNGSALGLTPLNVEGLDTGRLLKIRIEKEAYRPVYREIRFDPGEKIELNPGPMELRIGTLRYSVDLSLPNSPDLREILLSINGDLRKIEDSEHFEIPEGSHMVSLEHPDYYPLNERVTVLDQELTEVNLVLQPRPVRLQPIVSVDTPTRYLVDGIETPLTEQGYLPVPANRVAKVDAIVRDFLSVTQQFDGRPNERMQWNVPLKPIPGPVEGADWEPPYFDMPMKWLDPVEFTMGSPLDEVMRIPNEDRETQVQLSSGFWIGSFEVTQDLYFRVLGSRPSEFIGDRHPVDSIKWKEAMEFCIRLSEFERNAGRVPDGYEYRLPTEAEWEYAARAGTQTAFSFGTRADPSMGNFHGSFDSESIEGKSEEERYGSMEVGSFSPNGFGLYDVHGNVAEWTFDRFWDRHPGGTVADPVNIKSGRGYTVRGGSWRDSADRVRSAAREGVSTRTVRNSIGFRVVLASIPREK